MTEGRKDDTGKLRFDLIPPDMLMALASVLTYGGEKYDPRNWERGMAWSRCYAALQRHLTAYWAGEDIDAETGFPHLWHALACLTFLTSYQLREGEPRGIDDRGQKTIQMDVVTKLTARAVQGLTRVHE